MSELAIIIKIAVSVTTLITIWVLLESNGKKAKEIKENKENARRKEIDDFVINAIDLAEQKCLYEYKQKKDNAKSDTNAKKEINEIWKLNYELVLSNCNNIDLRLKVSKLEREIEKRDKKIRELENIKDNN